MLESFLKELHELCKKYDMSIGGCGCCGSPWINYQNETGEWKMADNLHFDDNAISTDECKIEIK